MSDLTSAHTTADISLSGSHYEMGYQHGQQVLPLRPQIIQAVQARLRQIEQDRPDAAFTGLVDETRRFLGEADPATFDFIRGQADGLGITFDWLLNYNLVNFLRDALTTRSPGDLAGSEGCTAWTAGGPATADGLPILVKNRDYRLEHLPLQIVVRARPALGYCYMYVTSAGNPGVFVAGINEAGLAVADTHVPCPDVGPGLPTFALSMHLLEEQSTVSAALAYLERTPRLGRNNLILADAGGHMAVFENGHSRYALLQAETGFLISTNHFNSPELKDCFVDTEPEPLRGNTFRRYQKVWEELTTAYGRIDLTMAKRLMAAHDGPLASLCRHPSLDSGSSTLCSIFLLPAQRRLFYGRGLPCQCSYRSFDCLETSGLNIPDSGD